MDTGPMKDNIFGSEAFVLLTKMEMHYRRNEFQNFLQNLALDAHDALHRKSTLAFIRHCSRVGGGGNDKLAIDKGGNLPEKVENHWSRRFRPCGMIVDRRCIHLLSSLSLCFCASIESGWALIKLTQHIADRVYVSLGTAGTYPGYGPVYRNVPW